MRRPPAPSLRTFELDAPFLTYEQVRATLAPLPAEQQVTVPREVRVVYPDLGAVIVLNARLH